MNPQLAAFLQNKPALFGVAAAGAVGLGLWTKKKKAAATSPAGSATIPGTLPAAAVVQPSVSGGYDSTAFDVYNAFQPEIDALRQESQRQTAGGGVTTAPTPVASTLLAPTYNGKYVQLPNGMVDEVESDGSLFWLTPSEHQQAFKSSGGNWATSGLVDVLPSNLPDGTVTYSTARNLAAKNPAPAAS